MGDVAVTVTDRVIELTEASGGVVATVVEERVVVVSDQPPATSAAAAAAAALAAQTAAAALAASVFVSEQNTAASEINALASENAAAASADTATTQAGIATAQAALADADRVLAEAAAAAALASQNAAAASAAIAVAAAAAINNIGTPGAQGFGVGICPVALPAGMGAMSGYADLASANYGNYQYSDGSVMCWIPAFYYKWGTGANGVALNEVSIKPESFFADVATANAAGYALHRAFYDGGAVQRGVFVDKYLTSNNGGIASSLANGIVLTSAQRGTLTTAKFNSLTGAPALNYSGALASAKTRGVNFFCNSRFIFAALAMLSYVHARASTNTTYCAWYHATNNFPKGNNNNALSDAQDATVTWTYDGNGTYLGVGKTGSASTFAKSTHNGQNCGVADLNGLVWEITPGLTSNGTNLYILKTSASMKAVTAGNTLATDLWGATGIAALYDDLGTTYGALTDSNSVKLFGSASQVFSEAASGNAWNAAGMGIPLAGGVGGTNAFGNDGLWDYAPIGYNELCPFSGGTWNTSSLAGVWAVYLGNVRTNSNNYVGFRAALYL